MQMVRRAVCMVSRLKPFAPVSGRILCHSVSLDSVCSSDVNKTRAVKAKAKAEDKS